MMRCIQLQSVGIILVVLCVAVVAIADSGSSSSSITDGEVRGYVGTVDGTDEGGSSESGNCTNANSTEERTQKDYYQTASHYDVLWGKDNLHIGYYPHLIDVSVSSDSSRPSADKKTDENVVAGEAVTTTATTTATTTTTPAEAAYTLTKRMIQLANITATDRVLDLGSGKGKACYDIATLTRGASCTGVDLTPNNVERANALARHHPHLPLHFQVGSFTQLPASIVNETEKYDVIFSQVAFCHVHDQLDTIFQQVMHVLKPMTGRFIVNDYLGGIGSAVAGTGTTTEHIHPDTLEHVFKRLHFSSLHGHKSWRRIADTVVVNTTTTSRNNESDDDDTQQQQQQQQLQLELLHYENMDIHMKYFYEQLVMGADHHGYISTDGTSLATNYNQTVAAIARNEIGMNLALFRTIPAS